MMKPQARIALSPQNKKILRQLILYVEKHHYQPSSAELAELCGLASVQRQLDRIVASGWLVMTGRARAIDIPDDVYRATVAPVRARKRKKSHG